jgi:2,3-bisphosphoglycerate-independent phosphoglycerate mutase
VQDLKFVGMMQYDGDLLLPANYLVPPPEIHKTSGEYLVHNNISTFACSETQKFGHVTFFWNGNRSGYFDSKLETYLEVGGGWLCTWQQGPEARHGSLRSHA